MTRGLLASPAGRLALAAVVLASAAVADGSRRPALSRDDAARLWDEALVARREGKPRDVLSAVGRLERSYPREPRYLDLEAGARAALGDRSGEARTWELYLRWAPTPAEACPRLGQAYEALGSSELALDAHRRCLALDPEKADLRFFYARALIAAKRPVQAEPILESILHEHPGYDDAALLLGRLRLDRGQTASAALLIEPALARHPTSPDPLLSGALVDLERHDLPRARRRLLLAMKSAPAYADLYRVLARVCDAAEDAACSERARGAVRDLEAGRSARSQTPEAP